MSSRTLTARAIVLTCVAAGLGRLALTDAHLAYVKPSMRIPLLISAALLAVLAIANANEADRIRHPEDEPDDVDGVHHHDDHLGASDDHGHDHSGVPRIGYWLLVPVVCIALVPLRPLGADAVSQRQTNAVATERRAATSSQDRDATGGEVTLLEFVDRTVNDPSNPFTDEVTLIGFVADDPSAPDGFVLGRFVMSCCAADAMPLLVRVVHPGEVPPVGDWVRVTGSHRPPPTDLDDGDRPLTENIVLEADEVEPIDEPSPAYESY